MEAPALDPDLARWSLDIASEPGALRDALVPAPWLAAMARKYAGVGLALEQRAGPEQAAALRRLAAAFPGALREAQLTAPAVLASRASWCEEGAARPWARWRAAGREAVPLWATAHRLLADVLVARAAHRGRIGAAELQAWLEGATPEVRGRWPNDPVRIAELATPGFRSRSALLWLGCWAGLSIDALGAALFDRTGHWDARPHDPAWSRRDPAA